VKGWRRRGLSRSWSIRSMLVLQRQVPFVVISHAPASALIKVLG